MGMLDGKVALVTGSSKGLGKAIALRLASLGADCVINYSRDAAPANEVCEEIARLGRQAIAVQADVSALADIERLFAAAKDRFGRLDIVVANAGIELVNVDLVDAKEEDFDRLFRVNAKGPFFVLQAAARSISDGGRIINVSEHDREAAARRVRLWRQQDTGQIFCRGAGEGDCRPRRDGEFGDSRTDRQGRNLHQHVR